MPLEIPQNIADEYKDDLNYILTVRDVYKQDCFIQMWLDLAADPEVSMVKVRSASGGRLDVEIGTRNGPKRLPVMPAGATVDRFTALHLLRDYGERGTYRGRHRATYLSKFDLSSMHPDMRERLLWGWPELEKEIKKLNNDYLIHVPRGKDDKTAIEELIDAAEAQAAE